MGGRADADWAAVVVNYNAAPFLDGCLRALTGGLLPPREIVVVDNASTDDSLAELAGWPRVLVEASPRNLGFAGGANRGVARTEASLVVLLNPDVDLAPDFGPRLREAFDATPRLGAAGAKLCYPGRDVIQHAGGVLEYPLLTTRHRGYGEADRGQWDAPAAVDFVTGGAMALRRAAFEAVGGFDESFYPAYYEDVDLCYRLRAAGWAVRYEPALTGTHFESVTLGRSLEYFRLLHRNRLRFALKHLDRAAWWGQFVPSETQRLRGELSAIGGDDWPARSGAEAIEELARRGQPLAGTSPPVLRGEPLADAIASLDEARQRAVIHPIPPAERSRGGRRLRGWLSRLSVRAYAEERFWRQRAFNEAVVRVLESQDRLNRETVATLLLTMLDLGEARARASDASPSDPAPSEQASPPLA